MHISLSRRCLAIVCAACIVLALVLAGPARAQEYEPVGGGVEAIPGPNGSLSGQAREIYVHLSGDAAVQNTRPFHVWLDGQEVTATCRRTGETIVCPLPAGLANGTHKISLTLPRLLGNDSELSWEFSKGRPHAEHASNEMTLLHNAKRTLYEGDTLEISMLGPPGGSAWVDVGDRIRVPLKETAAGTYTGTHDIVRSDYVTAEPVGHLRLPSGHTYRSQAEIPAKIMGSIFTIRVRYPQPGDKVPWNFTIVGRTRPHSRVTIAPMLGTRPAHQYGAVNDQSMNANMGAMEVTADDHGVFEQNFGFPIHMFALRYAFNVTAVDPEGNEALPAAFYVLVGADDDNKTKKSPVAPDSTPSPASTGQPSSNFGH